MHRIHSAERAQNAFRFACIEPLEPRQYLSGTPRLNTIGPAAPSISTTDRAGNTIVVAYLSGTVDVNPRKHRTLLLDGTRYGAFIAKYSRHGDLYWVLVFDKYFSGANPLPEIRGIATDNDGNIVMTGNLFSRFDFNPGTRHYTLRPDIHGSSFLWMLHADGTFARARFIDPTPGVELPYQLSIDAHGSVYIAGTTFERSYIGKPWPPRRAFLAKFSNDFSQRWSVVLPEGTEIPSALVFDRHASPLLATYDVEGIVPATDFTRFNGRGRFLSTHRMSVGPNSSNGVAIDDNDDIVLTGGATGPIDFDPGPGEFVISPKRPSDRIGTFLARYTPDFKLRFATAFNGHNRRPFAGSAVPAGVQIDRETGDLIVAGHFRGLVDFNPSSHHESLLNSFSSFQHGEDIFVARYTASGRFVSVSTQRTAKRDQSLSFRLLNDDSAIVTSLASTLESIPFIALLRLKAHHES